MPPPNVLEEISYASSSINFSANSLRKMAIAFGTTGNEKMKADLEMIAESIERQIKRVADAYAKDINHQVNASLKAFDDTMQAAFGKKG